MRSEALLTDLYQLTMMQGLFEKKLHRTRTVFDRFYRTNPFGGSYTIVAGLSHVISYLKNLSFSEDDIAYLASTGLFKERFLDYLRDFRFTGDVYAVPEGTVAFPKEILLRVEAPNDEAMLIETAISMFLNHESLIATKARRIRTVAGTDKLAEFGLRRAQGSSAALYGARAAMIGGFDGTSNVLAAAKFGMKPMGTMAHSWVMSFPSELEAFRVYAEEYENALTLLVDTYDTLRQGVPNAIIVFDEVRKRRGGTMPAGYGIRLDSGDLAFLSKQARKMLDAAGFTDAIIMATNDLDEYLIADLKRQGAEINGWGVGTKLITAEGNPALGGVYKLAGKWEGDTFIPKMKISDNVEKVTNPGIKKVYRLLRKDNRKLIGDVIALEGEEINSHADYIFKDYQYPWKFIPLRAGEFEVVDLLKPIFKDGELVYEEPSLQEIIAYGEKQISILWPEYLRLINPQLSKVNLSEKLMQLRNEVIEKSRLM